MSERNDRDNLGNQKGRKNRKMQYSFGKGKKGRVADVPLVEYDEDIVGRVNQPNNGRFELWPDLTGGGISQSARDRLLKLRPVEDEADLDNWPEKD